MIESKSINGRYEIKDPAIGKGGMGVVYKAYDSVTRRYVALKTLSAHSDPGAIELFEREWTVLARISHPNIVDILDTGEYREDNGDRRPYFVMPLLRGFTLDQLIKEASARLSVENVVEIMAQACRGLQAAHEQGLIHRDIKPSNLFIMDDDTVKIIDFGVVHLADTRSVTGFKGTLQYMAPEQIELKPATPNSDIFSLAVVCYEALTGRKPFWRRTDSEIIEAIRTQIPPPASQINATVNQLVSRTVHKGMAKQPWHRYSNAREFGDTLQKALRNEVIERFDRSKIQPRIDRVKKAQVEGDFQFAMEILTELESEGHIDPEMSAMRTQIEQTVRQKTIRQLLESARTRIEEDEYPLALQKIQDVLNLDSTNADAHSLKSQIERHRSEKQIANWFRLVHQHLDNQDYAQARQGIQEILKIDASDTRARGLLSSIDRTEKETIKSQEDKEKLYEAAVASYQNGEISTALSKLERVLEINRTGPKSPNPERDAQYQSLYNQVRSERDAARNAYAEGRTQLNDRNFARTLEICSEFLQKHPGDPLFQALKIETEETQRQEQSAAVAEINRRVEAEPDLDKKLNIVKDAVEKHPNEPHFKSSLKLVKERRDLINSIVVRARQYEEAAQLNDAAGQWDILRNIYPVYPGLDFEIQRLARRREEQVRDETKARWIEKVDRHLGVGEHEKARETVAEALLEFSNDKELQGLQSLTEQAIKRSGEATSCLRDGQALCAAKNYDEGIKALRKAERLDERNDVIRSALVGALLQQARELMVRDWHLAEPLVAEVLDLDRSDPVARSLSSFIEDHKRQEAVDKLVLDARNLQASGDLNGALKKIEDGLAIYPSEIRLSHLHNTFRAAHSEARRKESPAAPRPVDQPLSVRSEFPSATSFSPAAVEEGYSPAPVATPALVHSSFPPVANGLHNLAESDAPTNATVIPSPVFDSPIDQTSVTKQGSPNRSRMVFGVLAAAILLIAAALLLKKSPPPHKTVPASDLRLTVQSNAPDSSYTLDGRSFKSGDTVSLGSHAVVAAAPGFASETEQLTVTKGVDHLPSLVFNLLPIQPTFRITSGLKAGAGKYILDNGKPVDLQDGSLAQGEIKPGDHTVKILDGSKEVVSLSFHIGPKQAPVLTSPLVTKGAPAVVACTFGRSAKLYATANMKGGLEGQALQPMAPGGVDLTLDQEKSTRFALDDGKGKPRVLPISFSASPLLDIVLSGASDRVPLSVAANVQDAIVVINGIANKRAMTNGARTMFLPPGNYKVTVTHDGYQPVAEQQVVIKQGDTSAGPVLFSLVPVPSMSTLAITSAPIGAEVLIDDKNSGAVGSDSTFSREVTPGQHRISIKKLNYEDFGQQLDFRVGQTSRLNAESMKGPGTVTVRVKPAEATVRFRRLKDSTDAEVADGQSIPLAAGTYEFSAEADNYQPAKQSVTIVSGQPTTVEFGLKANVEPPKPVVTPATYFGKDSGWREQGGWWVHDAKGFTFLPRSGVFSLAILNPKEGKAVFKNKIKRITLLADFSPDGNGVVYTLDPKNLSRRTSIDGHLKDENKLDSGLGSDQFYRLTVEITPETIILKNAGGRVVDTIHRTNASGRVGFQDEVAIRPLK